MSRGTPDYAALPIEQVLAMNRQIASPFQINKVQTLAARNWDQFYKSHASQFFKDRHWTSAEFFDEMLSENGTDKIVVSWNSANVAKAA